MTIAVDNPLVLLPLIVGGIFIICGLLLYYFPPKEINHLYGYRTKTSMQNQEIWDFAQKYSGKIMAIVGILYMLMAFPFSFLDLNSENFAVLIPIGTLLFFCVLLFIIVEKRLKQKFPKK